MAVTEDYKAALESFGYGITWEHRGLLAGDPAAGYWIAAKSTNPESIRILLEIARTMPQTQRHKVCFAIVPARCKAGEGQFVFWLDAIGGGDKLVMIPTRKLKKDRRKLTSLYQACGYFGKKSLLVQEKRPLLLPGFPWGVAIRTMEKGKAPLDETNVNILRAALTTYICRAAGE